MANKHIIKLSDTEAVLKIYITASAGGTVDIDLENDLTAPTQTFLGNPDVGIQEIHWGAKKDKQIDVTRVVPSDPSGVHGHYYLLNTGSYKFVGFVDNVYSSRNIRIVGDGPFHVLIKLRKTSGWTNL